jgi:hypothetical protein
MSKGEVIELHPPLPGLPLSVHIEFRSGAMGKLKRSAPSSRVEATHAEIITVTTGGKEMKEEVELAVVDEYLRKVDEFRERIAEKREVNAQQRVVSEAHVARRAEVQASFSSPCARCGVDRERGDDRHVVVGAPSDGTNRTSTATGFISMPTVTYVEYVCPVCGSVEWFRRNHLEHPPPG